MPAKPNKPPKPSNVAYSMFINTREYLVLNNVHESNQVVAIDPNTGEQERISIAQLEDIAMAARKQQRILSEREARENLRLTRPSAQELVRKNNNEKAR
jgi:hypothetical protein